MSWLEGRGTGFRVPPYLRYDGQVKNLHIDAKMTGEMIADLLRAKEEGGQQETRLADFLLQFTNLRYSTITLQMEFSYNLVDGLDRFKVSLTFPDSMFPFLHTSPSPTSPCSGTC